MTGRAGRQAAPAAGRDGWLACLPELACAAFLVLSTSLAVYAYAGLGATAFTVGGWTLAALALLPAFIPAGSRPLVEQAQRQGRHHTSFLGFWGKRRMLHDATASMASYDTEMRPVLQHLLAARLAERHGVNLYHDPAAARRLLLPGPRDDALWFWLDPARPAQAERQQVGIPARTLATIIDRLERL
ncbi:MAG TPA: hypothetical protein VMB74_00805 [Streptosporangiaceae bacterium]|nr:hypothetical protein [Streptosporangiaceae bacterium]